MEALMILVCLFFIAGPIIAIVALVMASRAVGEAERAAQRTAAALQRIEMLERSRSEGRLPAAVPAQPPAPLAAAPPAEPLKPAPALPFAVPAAQPAPPRVEPKPLMTVLPEAVRPAPAPKLQPAPAVAPEPAKPQAKQAARESAWLDAEGLISWAKVEEIIGKRWMTWAGVLALFVAAALFAKFAFDRKWFGPGAQILIAVAFGLALAALGVYFLRKGLRPFGQGLLGGGIMILYAALFCAYSPEIYDVPPIESPMLVFGLMCIVTAAGMAAAVVFDSLPIAFLAILGGLLTPVLVSTGRNERDGLFAYLLLLDLGVLGVAFYRKWRALDVLAFVGTAALFAAWFHKFYAPAYAADHFAGTVVWLYAFYAVFLVLPFVQHLVTRTEVTIERFIMALVNATFVFGYAWRILNTDHDPALAALCCAMSAAYLALGVLTARRIPSDRKSILGFIVLSMSLLTIAIPVYFDLNGITIGWTAEAVVLLWLGYQYRYLPARAGAFLVLIFALWRVFWIHWPDAMRHKELFTLVFNREFLILLCAPIGAAACAVIHRVFRAALRRPEPAEREAHTAFDAHLARVEGLGAGLILLALLHVELGQWLTLRAGAGAMDPAYLKGCVLSVMWALGAAAFLAAGWRESLRVTVCVGLLPLLVAVLHVFNLYSLSGHGAYFVLNPRFWSSALVLGVGVAFAFAARAGALRTAGLILAGYSAIALVDAETFWWTRFPVPLRKWDVGYETLWRMALIGAVGAAGFAAAARRWTSAAARVAGYIPLALSVAFMFVLYLAFVAFDRAGVSLGLNARFLAGLAVVAAIAAFALVEREPRQRALGLVGAAWALVVLAFAEPWLWVKAVGVDREWDVNYVRAWVSSLVWSAGALGFLVAWLWRRSREAYLGGMPALGLALLFAAAGYGVDRLDYAFVLNARALVALLALGVWAAYGLSAATRNGKVFGLVFAGWATLAFAHAETWQWTEQCLDAAGDWLEFEALWRVTLVWAVGAAGYFVVARRLRVRECYFAAALPLLIGLGSVIAMNFVERPTWLFVNPRFIASNALVAAAFLGVGFLYHDREALGPNAAAWRRVLLWASMLGLLVILSLEPFRWCRRHIADPERARMTAQMSLSVVWAVYAAAVLWLGFWKRTRSIRFAALTLFALTGLKLVFVDLAGINQVYRIISFFTLGVLMVASAYLYNKAEGWLKETDAPGAR